MSQPSRRRPPRPLIPILALAALLVGPAGPLRAEGPAATASPAPGGPQESLFESPYREVGQLNAGLPQLAEPPDLATPQSSLANFIEGCDRGDYGRAAHSLDLNAVEPARQPVAGPRLARQLKAVMDHQIWFKWEEVPDRPDGLDDSAADLSPARPRGPRSNLRLGTVFIGDRDYEVRLERVKPNGRAPVWVFSRQTVAAVPTLYRHFGPTRLEASIPEVLKRTKFAKVALWQWIGFAVILLAGALLGWLVQKGLNLALHYLDRRWTRAVAEAIRGPGALAIGLGVFYSLSDRFLGLAGPINSVLNPLYLAALVGTLIWFTQRLIRLLSGVVSRRYESVGSDEANLLLTRIAVVRHLLMFAVVVGGAIYILTRFEWFREIGVTLLASAGVAGLIIGVAAQRVLGNLFAGFILATFQPVRSGDAILFEGEFGWIEEIALTYLVVRTWDLRRLVVPLTYFLDRPFQNWSRRSQQLIQPFYLYTDYRIDVGAVREEFRRILEESPDWDRAVSPILQVTDCKPETLELRGLCSASDPTANWNLRCHVRERLIAFIQGMDDGRYLPRKRVALVGSPDEAVGPGADGAGRNGPGAGAAASAGGA